MTGRTTVKRTHTSKRGTVVVLKAPKAPKAKDKPSTLHRFFDYAATGGSENWTKKR